MLKTYLLEFAFEEKIYYICIVTLKNNSYAKISTKTF